MPIWQGHDRFIGDLAPDTLIPVGAGQRYTEPQLQQELKMVAPTKIFCWHGTTKGNAKKISKEGFLVGTWFALHLEDALVFGGNFVFMVEFDLDKFHPGDKGDEWQFHISAPVLPNRIRSLTKYMECNLFLNPEIITSC